MASLISWILEKMFTHRAICCSNIVQHHQKQHKRSAYRFSVKRYHVFVTIQSHSQADFTSREIFNPPGCHHLNIG